MPRKLLCDVEKVLFVFQAFKTFSSLLTLMKVAKLPFTFTCFMLCCLLFPNILPGVDPGFVESEAYKIWRGAPSLRETIQNNYYKIRYVSECLFRATLRALAHAS
jgi:hypothetical protein